MAASEKPVQNPLLDYNAMILLLIIVASSTKFLTVPLPKNRGPSRRFLGPHIFDRVSIANGIEHRLTKPYHPWTNGTAERMNRTIKDTIVEPTTMMTWRA